MPGLDSPSLIRTRRMYFSPRKFLISTRVPVSWMTTLMGKWAYTDRILYRKPCIQKAGEAPNLIFSQPQHQRREALHAHNITNNINGTQGSPKWLPWSCFGRGCKWCGLWPAPSYYPTIYPHEAGENRTTATIKFTFLFYQRTHQLNIKWCKMQSDDFTGSKRNLMGSKNTFSNINLHSALLLNL